MLGPIDSFFVIDFKQRKEEREKHQPVASSTAPWGRRNSASRQEQKSYLNFQPANLPRRFWTQDCNINSLV